jgi:hypothetical protein
MLPIRKVEPRPPAPRAGDGNEFELLEDLSDDMQVDEQAKIEALKKTARTMPGTPLRKPSEPPPVPDRSRASHVTKGRTLPFAKPRSWPTDSSISELAEQDALLEAQETSPVGMPSPVTGRVDLPAARGGDEDGEILPVVSPADGPAGKETGELDLPFSGSDEDGLQVAASPPVLATSRKPGQPPPAPLDDGDPGMTIKGQPPVPSSPPAPAADPAATLTGQPPLPSSPPPSGGPPIAPAVSLDQIAVPTVEETEDAISMSLEALGAKPDEAPLVTPEKSTQPYLSQAVVDEVKRVETKEASGDLDALTDPAARPARAPLLLDVTANTLGVATVGGYVEVLVRKNSPVPIEQRHLFTTGADFQERAVIRVVEGESNRSDENHGLGEVELVEIRKAPRGEIKIEVMFEITVDGILQVSARNMDTGEAQSTRLTLFGG